MRETRAIEVALVVDEHLGLVDEGSERGRINHAVAVALEFGPICGRILRMAPAARARRMRCVRREPTAGLERRRNHRDAAAITARNKERSGAGATTAWPSRSTTMSLTPLRSAFL